MSKLNILEDLFELELRDIYDAEKQLAQALPKILKKVTDTELKALLQSGVSDAEEQAKRLEMAFTSLNLKPKTKQCAGMAGLLDEASSLLRFDGDPAVLDAACIAAMLRVKQYEISAYGTLAAWSKLLNHPERVLLLLAESEREEKAEVSALSRLAAERIDSAALEAEGVLAH